MPWEFLARLFHSLSTLLNTCRILFSVRKFLCGALTPSESHPCSSPAFLSAPSHSLLSSHGPVPREASHPIPPVRQPCMAQPPHTHVTQSWSFLLSRFPVHVLASCQLGWSRARWASDMIAVKAPRSPSAGVGDGVWGICVVDTEGPQSYSRQAQLSQRRGTRFASKTKP